MDNAGEPFRPVLASGKEYDAVAAALPPLLEEMKRQHAERRRRGDRSTRKTASLLQRGSGAGFLGFLGFLHKFTISFREHLSTTMSASSGPGSSSMLEPEPLRKVSAHAGNDPSRAKCRLESTAEPVKCVAEAAGVGDAENMRRIQRRLVSVAAHSITRSRLSEPTRRDRRNDEPERARKKMHRP